MAYSLRCINCVAYDSDGYKDSGAYGLCRRAPPLIYGVNGVRKSAFPVVHGTLDWCTEWDDGLFTKFKTADEVKDTSNDER